ncbi:MAG: Uma2 family endonuclease, partial [Thermicanus sp.]|nr:Uma2 family endonuclease [Thermicanus sp.]
PDIVIVHRNRASLITHRGIEGPPDLIVEILSISTALKDKKIKREVYARFGVPEYWIIDPIYRLLEQNILNETGNYTLHQVYREGDRERVTSPNLPCLSFSMEEVFIDLDLITP